MEIRYLDSVEWQALMQERRQEERLIDESIARGEVDPENLLFGYQLGKRVKKIHWNHEALMRFKL